MGSSAEKGTLLSSGRRIFSVHSFAVVFIPLTGLLVISFTHGRRDILTNEEDLSYLVRTTVSYA